MPACEAGREEGQQRGKERAHLQGRGWGKHRALAWCGHRRQAGWTPAHHDSANQWIAGSGLGAQGAKTVNLHLGQRDLNNSWIKRAHGIIGIHQYLQADWCAGKNLTCATFSTCAGPGCTRKKGPLRAIEPSAAKTCSSAVLSSAAHTLGQQGKQTCEIQTRWQYTQTTHDLFPTGIEGPQHCQP